MTLLTTMISRRAHSACRSQAILCAPKHLPNAGSPATSQFQFQHVQSGSREFHRAVDKPFVHPCCARATALPRERGATRNGNRRPQTNNANDGGAGNGTSTAFRERLRALRHNGTPELVCGTLLLSLVALDYFLQEQNGEERDSMVRRLERDVRIDGAESRKQMMSSYLGESSTGAGGETTQRPRFKCTVRRVPEMFDGHKCLANLQVGDVVDVIEEGVGPGGSYNLCSITRNPLPSGEEVDIDEDEERKINVSIGWFPCSCLQKME